MRVSPENGRGFQINGTRSFNCSNQQLKQKYNLSSGVSVLHYYAHFRPVGCALGMKFESCDWCPAPPSSNGFFVALVFGGELPNGFLFEIAAGFIHRENRLHRRFLFEI